MHAGIDVQHDPAQRHFSATVDGVRAELEYRQRDGVIEITHTRVPPAIGGRGIAAALVRTALEYADAEGLKVVPTCSYAASYIERHPQYQGLLAG